MGCACFRVGRRWAMGKTDVVVAVIVGQGCDDDFGFGGPGRKEEEEEERESSVRGLHWEREIDRRDQTRPSVGWGRVG